MAHGYLELTPEWSQPGGFASTPPGSSHQSTPSSGGIAALNPRLMALTPPGSKTGGIAALNPRLIALTPPGSKTGGIAALNPRLIALTPPGSKTGGIAAL